MIKIEIDQSTRETIEKLHWEWFKKYLKDNPQTSNILKVLKLARDEDLKSIILGDPFDSVKKYGSVPLCKIPIVKRKEKTIYESDLSTLLSKIEEIDTANKIHQELESFFSYDSFYKGSEWNPYLLFGILNINVCPYCNRQYIFTIGSQNTKKTRPELDHFFPQTKYPYLALSLYNFIPSCHICNHAKNDRGQNIIYPYTESFEHKDDKQTIIKDAKFRSTFLTKLKNEENILHSNNIKIYFNTKACHIFQMKQRIRNSIDTFHLDEIYNEHKLDLQDLFTRYRNYSDPKIDEITKLILNERLTLDGLSLSEESKAKLYHKIAKTYTKRIKRTILGLPLGAGDKQYPLRKFKEDIIEQLDETARKMKEQVQTANTSQVQIPPPSDPIA